MSLEKYIATIKKTKTYQADLISIQEYSFKKRALGFITTLPSVPQADDDRQIVIMEIKGNQPNILTVLKEPGQSIQPTTKDVDKLLFIFVEMRPHTLNIESPPKSYRLSDGNQIDAKFSVTYKVEDAKEFWKGHRDQLFEFETAIINAAKNFFINTSSDVLIGYPGDSKKALETQIREAEIGAVKNNLEDDIFKSCSIAGICIQKVIADVHMGESLYKYLQRIRKKLYGEGGVAERSKIDQIIENDSTFAPHKLRTVINTLDMRLLENFYTMDWSDAMRKVTERVAEKKEEYMMSVEQKEIKKMHDLKSAADSLGLDQMDIDDLKSKMAKNLLLMADKNNNTHEIPDNEFIELMISPSLNQLPNPKSKPKSTGDE